MISVTRSLARRGIRDLRPFIHRPSCVSIGRSLTTARTSTSDPSKNFRLVGFLAVSLIFAAAGIHVWESSTSEPSLAPSGKTFDFKIRFPAGVQTYTFPLKSDAEIEAMLHENETSERIRRLGNPVIRWDRNWVGSNEPCEDRSAVDMIPRGPGAKHDHRGTGQAVASKVEEGSRDIMMFSVLDGHAGDATSKLLASSLHPTIGLALASLQAGHGPVMRVYGLKAWSSLFHPFAWMGKASWTPDNVILSIQHA